MWILPYCSFGGIPKYDILIYMSDMLTNEEKLHRILELTEENNKILRRMDRAQTMGTIFRLLYWALIIGSLVASYYYIKPIISELLGSTQGVLQQFQGMKGAVPDVNALEKVLNEAGAGALSQ
jgi:hypothetical protein